MEFQLLINRREIMNYSKFFVFLRYFKYVVYFWIIQNFRIDNPEQIQKRI